MTVMISESSLRDAIMESVKQALNESRGLKSKKLYDITRQYGGFHRDGYHRVFDVHNMTDDDVVGVLDVRQLQDAQREIIGDGRWYNERGLTAWVQKHGYSLEPGDGAQPLLLGDGKHYAIVIVRNERQVRGREGQGWDATDQKRSEREENRRNDGKHAYVPEKRDGEWGKLIGNPWKRDFTDEEKKAIMDRIRQRRKNGEWRKVY